MKDISEVVRAYSGKPGCRCGCKGKYYEIGNRTLTTIYNKIRNNLVDADEDHDSYTNVKIGNREYTVYYVN